MRSLVAATLGARLHMGLSADGLALLHARGAWAAQPETLGEWPLEDGAADDPARLAELCAPVVKERGHAGLPLSITLSDDRSRLFMVTPPQNSAHLQDLRSAAAMRFQILYGESPADWQIAGDDDMRHPFLACALPRARVAAARQLASACGLRLISLLPQFVAVWNRAFPELDGAWLGVVQGGTLTLGTLGRSTPAAQQPGRRRLVGVHRLPIPAAGGDAPWLSDEIGRVALREGRSLPRELKLFGRCAPEWLVPGACPNLVVDALELAGPAGSAAFSAPVLLARSGAAR